MPVQARPARPASHCSRHTGIAVAVLCRSLRTLWGWKGEKLLPRAGRRPRRHEERKGYQIWGNRVGGCPGPGYCESGTVTISLNQTVLCLMLSTPNPHMPLDEGAGVQYALKSTFVT